MDPAPLFSANCGLSGPGLLTRLHPLLSYTNSIAATKTNAAPTRSAFRELVSPMVASLAVDR